MTNKPFSFLAIGQRQRRSNGPAARHQRAPNFSERSSSDLSFASIFSAVVRNISCAMLRDLGGLGPSCCIGGTLLRASASRFGHSSSEASVLRRSVAY